MEKFYVEKSNCFLVKAVEISNLDNKQLYVDWEGVKRFYPFGKSSKTIEIEGGTNKITVSWKDGTRGVTMLPVTKNSSEDRIFIITEMYNKGKYYYQAPDNPESKVLICCINE